MEGLKEKEGDRANDGETPLHYACKCVPHVVVLHVYF